MYIYFWKGFSRNKNLPEVFDQDLEAFVLEKSLAELYDKYISIVTKADLDETWGKIFL